jgi:hypothetical protein
MTHPGSCVYVCAGRNEDFYRFNVLVVRGVLQRVPANLHERGSIFAMKHAVSTKLCSYPATWSNTLGSAPASSRARITGQCPLLEDKCNGVQSYCGLGAHVTRTRLGM